MNKLTTIKIYKRSLKKPLKKKTPFPTKKIMETT